MHDELRPDEALMLAYRDGDAAAFEALYARHRSRLYRYLAHQCGDSRLAEEATHDVFLNLWQHPEAYDASRGPFAGWLFRVARNRAISVIRFPRR